MPDAGVLAGILPAIDAVRNPGLTRGSAVHGRPAFLLTIDTEGDDLWSRPKEITTENLKFLPRFQSLCERYGFKPTYLTNWEAAVDRDYQAFARDVLARGAGEVGLHIHAWNSPPIMPLTDDDFHHQPYLTEYPAGVIAEKVRRLTGTLEETFERKMVSHRGGRWAFDDIYARILIANGYTVDCSVTPNVSWRPFPGAPGGDGGPDYTEAPDAPHFLPVGARPGEGQLLEAPVTILKRRRTPPERWLRKALNRPVDRVLWMWPTGRNLRNLFEVVDCVVAERRPYLELAMHSSELMPGASPSSQTPRDIERLYDHLEALFARVQVHFGGQTLGEFAAAYRHDYFVGSDVPHAEDQAGLDSNADFRPVAMSVR